MALTAVARMRRVARMGLSYLPSLHAIRRPEAWRAPGLSAMMTVKNEEEWVELSLRSISTIADEIVFVDNGSTDATLDVAMRTAERYNLPARILSFVSEDFCAAVNYALSQTTRRWIFRWHGDFIGRTSGNSSLRQLRRRIEQLDTERYFCLLVGPVSLDGDVYHQEYQSEVELEPLIFTYSPRLQFRQSGRFETLSVPYFYEKIDIHDLYFFHMRWVKPPIRLLYRWFWTEWMGLVDKSRWPTLTDYVKYKIREQWGDSELHEAANALVNSRCKKFVPYDEKRFGEYPDLLRDILRRPPFRIVYREGKIVGRSDALGGRDGSFLKAPHSISYQPTDDVAQGPL